MNKEPNINEPEAFDDEGLFDERPSSRLVWIVPSVVLHLLVFLIWFLMPEKEHKEVKSREIVLKSDQAEQLKQFVEDTNLRELRAEVRRLQEIKETMASIRSGEMVEFKEFESTMRSSVDAEAGQVLAELLVNHKTFAASQAVVAQQLSKIDLLFDEVKPLVEKKAIADIVPYAEKAIQAREILKTHFNKMNEAFLLLPAKQDSADSVVSWMTNSEVLQMWQQFSSLQERMFALQGKCSEEQEDYPYQQGYALKMIVKDGAGYEPRIQKSIADEQKAWLDYESKKKKYTETIASNTVIEKEQELKLVELSEKLLKIKADKEALNKEKGKFGYKTPEDKKNRVKLDKQIKKMSSLYSGTSKEKSATERKHRGAKKNRTNAENYLKRLKEPSSRWKQDRKRIYGYIDKYLRPLADKAFDVVAQQEACNLEQETVQLLKSLIEKVDHNREAAK